jgi:hypothetical protein
VAWAAPALPVQEAYRLLDPSFERGLPAAWRTVGGVRSIGAGVGKVSYFGRRALALERGNVRLELMLGVDA